MTHHSGLYVYRILLQYEIDLRLILIPLYSPLIILHSVYYLLHFEYKIYKGLFNRLNIFYFTHLKICILILGEIAMQNVSIEDARIVKTKNDIEKAMITLLTEKSYDKITVKDICTEAEISRATFYNQFNDKNDFVKKYRMTVIKKLTRVIANDDRKNQVALFKKLLSLITQQDELFLLLISMNGSPEVQETFKMMIRENAKKNILKYIDFQFQTKQEVHYFAVFMSNAIFGIIQEWVRSGRQESIEELINIINKITPVNFK
ncbi:TetR/AcrR family transcriptional regulator [Staphylococcus felis]|nr:TetR/AcrR family transcriptional regulator [Staphylococcus felis]REI14053.1 TetR/AcrR family transcriptional regulator [Staphylococcus felis]REI23890.1 TetR/AcrR family transcriptional regulator [Staphylococcus felis]